MLTLLLIDLLNINYLGSKQSKISTSIRDLVIFPFIEPTFHPWLLTKNNERVQRVHFTQYKTEVLSKNGMFYRDISFQEGQKTKSQKSSQTGICLFANIYQSICHYVNILRFCFDTHKQAYCNISMKILQYACLQISKVKHACLIILFCFLLL